MTDTRPVAWWLRVVAAFVVATLIVGGATRITDSGLSITEWAPLLGVIPPLSEAGWEAALEAYRQIPEYQLVNRGMSMEAFKVIYYWEWGHRLIARLIGVVFLLPFLYFWARGRLPDWFKPWGVLLLAMGALQGAVGWWMVRSGLVERVDVSQYRLAVHLTLACLILALAVWLSERLAGRGGTLAAPPLARWSALVLPFTLLGQIALGALVAGMDAGLASDTWPLMLGALVPQGLTALEPAWLNAFENPLAAQFNHRVGGYLVLALALVHLAAAWRVPDLRRGAAAIVALVTAQAVGGVLVVMWHVPPLLAGLHQALAAVLLWVAVVHASRAAAPWRSGERRGAVGGPGALAAATVQPSGDQP